MITAEDERDRACFDDGAGAGSDLIANGGDGLEETLPGIAFVAAFGDGDVDAAEVANVVVQRSDALDEAGETKGAGAHVGAAPSGAEVDGDSDDLDCGHKTRLAYRWRFPVPTQRFPMRLSNVLMRALLWLFVTHRGNAYVEAGLETVAFRMGPIFRHTVARADVGEAQRHRWPIWAGLGWHAALHGSLALIGSTNGVVEMSEPPFKSWVLLCLKPVHRNPVSMETRSGCGARRARGVREAGNAAIMELLQRLGQRESGDHDGRSARSRSSEGTIDYHNTQEVAFQTTLHEILMHMLLHSARHPGEVAAALGGHGLEAPKIDLNGYLRAGSPEPAL